MGPKPHLSLHPTCASASHTSVCKQITKAYCEAIVEGTSPSVQGPSLLTGPVATLCPKGPIQERCGVLFTQGGMRKERGTHCVLAVLPDTPKHRLLEIPELAVGAVVRVSWSAAHYLFSEKTVRAREASDERQENETIDNMKWFWSLIWTVLLCPVGSILFSCFLQWF